jgi:hypothetical protein
VLLLKRILNHPNTHTASLIEDIAKDSALLLSETMVWFRLVLEQRH